MDIREATEADIPAMVNLLKLSMGETLMPKTEAFWRWKHLENPFGKSDVLLAFEGDTLAGIRAFMKWEWTGKGQRYRAIRSVDAATHPDYQGRGIFRSLTLALLEKCRAEGIDFVFNTPNRKSKQGSIKMGWHEAGRLRLRVRPILSSAPKSASFDEEYAWSQQWSQSFSFNNDDPRLVTSVSTRYLTWRYGSNPLIRYNVVAEPVSQPRYAIIFRLKPGKFGTEFRVCDVFLSDVSAGREANKQLVRAVKKSGARFVSWNSPHVYLASTPMLPVGPMVTLLPISPSSTGITFKTWSPSIGDLEVF